MRLKTVTYIFKGENCLTEMYSAISAEVPVGDVGKFNAPLFQHCVNTDKVLSPVVISIDSLRVDSLWCAVKPSLIVSISL